jgi:2-polyprenyl-3-methyl-5-hydroxy-6-metoxy-1,4-benzoquinol methylase
MNVICCRGCGLAYVDPLPSADELSAYYADRYRLEYKQASEPSLTHVHRAGRVALERFRTVALLAQPPARVLDCGAGGGEFSYLLSSRGYRLTGIEPNSGYRQFAQREYGVDLRAGTLADNDFAPGEFDLITIFHVLEHVRDPRGGLDRLSGWLRPGGHLYVEVPNALTEISSPSNLYHRAHLYYFSASPLARLGVAAGLEPVLIDGGPRLANLTAIFRKSVPPPAAEDPTAHEAVVAANRNRTLRKYLTAGPTWAAVAPRLWRRAQERRAASSGLSARALLDTLYQREAPRVHRGAVAPETD